MKRLVLLVCILGISFLWGISEASAQFTEAGVEKFRAVVDAPDFTLNEVGGGKVSLKELRGKIILLNFFATW